MFFPFEILLQNLQPQHQWCQENLLLWDQEFYTRGVSNTVSEADGWGGWVRKTFARPLSFGSLAWVA